jgi:hypothetical protein
MRPHLYLRRTRAGVHASVDEEAVRRTDALLARLPAREWTVFADVDVRHGVEHVLIGPGGVFAITSHKPATACARVRDGVLWLRRDRDTRADRPGMAINRHVLDAARALHREIRTRTGRGPLVHPVVTLWCEFPQGVAESRRIAFVHGRDLAAWLTHRPVELDQTGRQEIAQAVQALSAIGPVERSARRPPRSHLPHRRAA